MKTEKIPSLYSLVEESKIKEMLTAFASCVGLPVQLIDEHGNILLSFGETAKYCSVFKENVPRDKRESCSQLHANASKKAITIGETYIFSCHANLNHIAYPLINRGELLGSVILGPFLMDRPDSTLVSEIAERYLLDPVLSLELYDDLGSVCVLQPPRVNCLRRLLDQLLSSLMPGERAVLIQTQQKMYQQAKINETIQRYKEQNASVDLDFLYEKEKELIAKVRTGSLQEGKALLNDVIGEEYLQISEQVN